MQARNRGIIFSAHSSLLSSWFARSLYQTVRIALLPLPFPRRFHSTFWPSLLRLSASNADMFCSIRFRMPAFFGAHCLSVRWIFHLRANNASSPATSVAKKSQPATAPYRPVPFRSGSCLRLQPAESPIEILRRHEVLLWANTFRNRIVLGRSRARVVRPILRFGVLGFAKVCDPWLSQQLTNSLDNCRSAYFPASLSRAGNAVAARRSAYRGGGQPISKCLH